MKFTNYVLELLAKGELSKEASLDALAMSKEAGNPMDYVTGRDNAKPLNWQQMAAAAGIMYGVPKALDLAERGVSHLLSGRNQAANNALFQKLMQQHQGLQGKDPIRAKANFDYIVKETPHLADHPIILGDHVANMTSMGTTDPATLNMLANMTKSRSDAHSSRPNNAADTVGDMLSKNYLMHNVKDKKNK